MCKKVCGWETLFYFISFDLGLSREFWRQYLGDLQQKHLPSHLLFIHFQSLTPEAELYSTDGFRFIVRQPQANKFACLLDKEVAFPVIVSKNQPFILEQPLHGPFELSLAGLDFIVLPGTRGRILLQGGLGHVMLLPFPFCRRRAGGHFVLMNCF